MQTYTTPTDHVVLLDDDVILPGCLSIGSHGYPQLTGVRSGVVVLLHRWLLGIVDDGRSVIGDHRNGDRLDNRRANLRAVTTSESSSNVAARAGSGYRGVYACRGRWQAKGKRAGVQHYLGTYDTAEEAAVIARAWRLEYLPGYVDRPAAVSVPT